MASDLCSFNFAELLFIHLTFVEMHGQVGPVAAAVGGILMGAGGFLCQGDGLESFFSAFGGSPGGLACIIARLCSVYLFQHLIV